jgi:hypothetical protein
MGTGHHAAVTAKVGPRKKVAIIGDGAVGLCGAIAGGVEKNVTFVEKTDPGINAEIDTEYRTKYSGYSARYVNPMVAPEARATTMKHVPR